MCQKRKKIVVVRFSRRIAFNYISLAFMKIEIVSIRISASIPLIRYSFQTSRICHVIPDF